MTDIHARPFYDSPTRRQKETEQQKLEADIAAFQKAGGRVQVLGDTPLKKAKSRRQVIEGRLPSPSRKEQAA
ncbi:hypothetical protein [Stenotrophomonas sp. SrG]|mgnify:CR=1 FL=1|uniref:hypothetical protein n=1 Tax=Stenotrophomonas sp. SrG TaxID=3414430 RepID=UPI003CF5CF1D